MNRSDTIGIIGGTGWLGGTLASRLLKDDILKPCDLYLSNRSGACPLAGTGVRRVESNQELVDACSTVIIAVRPEHFGDLNICANGKLLVSLMAGVCAKTVKDETGAAAVVRAMPNAAVTIGQSYSPWYCREALAPSDALWVQRVLECVGTAHRVPTEDCIDYLSALSGTGPAYPALLMTALVRHGIAAGLPEEVARSAAASVVVGASQLLKTVDPQEMIDSLTAYQGVTAAALESLHDAHFEDMIGRAVEAGAAVARKGM